MYCMVFVIHFFIDATGHNNALSGTASFSSAISNARINGSYGKFFLKHARDAKQVKKILRFNKRYPKEDCVLEAPCRCCVPLNGRFTDVPELGHPTAYLLFSVILAQSMRGPPVV